jgi:nucleoside phosphorylase
MSEVTTHATPIPQKQLLCVAIYTIKDIEFLAVLDRLGRTTDFTGNSGQRYKTANISTQTADVNVMLFRGVNQGNAEAQTLIQRAIADVKPDWVFVVGIAGGAPHKDFTIGDVIVASELLEFTYEEKRDNSPSTLHPRTLPLHRLTHGFVSMLPAVLRQIAQWSAEQETTKQRPAPPTIHQIAADVPEVNRAKLEATIRSHLDKPRTDPKVVTGTVGSSNALIKSTDFLAQISGGFKFLLCVEMESAGCYAACNTNAPIPMLAIRGISDIVGVVRSEEWTEYACQTAASLAMHLLRSGQLSPATQEAPTIEAVLRSVSGTTSKTAGLLSLRNIQHFGDTDIFPRPYELGVFRDLEPDSEVLLDTMDHEFDEFFPRYPPSHLSTLSQVGYAGFRWASQLDPLYNAYWLSLVIRIAPAIESTRLRRETRHVFSYRFAPDYEKGRLFDDIENWDTFTAATRENTSEYPWVVRTDIADFYSRISHERLAAAIGAVQSDSVVVHRIAALLSSYSKNSGIGLPVGGPAARILSEVYLNASDHVLKAKGIKFCRFADDYVLFAKTEHDAIQVLSELARILSEYDGLSLQKLKTRIMRKGEYLRSYVHELDSELDKEAVSFLHLRIRYDPYSENAEEDYRLLQERLSDYDVLGMLATEMKKSRLHQQLTKKLLHAARFITDIDVDSAVIVVAENLRSLLPVFTSVSSLLFTLIERAHDDSREFVRNRIVALLEGDDAPPLLELHRLIAVRLLAALAGETGELSDVPNIIWRQYEKQDSILVQKECIWGLLRTRSASLIKPLLDRFDRTSQWERRALLAASFATNEAGVAFRRSISQRMSPFEKLVLKWCDSRNGQLFERPAHDL